MSTQATSSANSSFQEGRNGLKIVCYYDLFKTKYPDFIHYSDEIINENLCTHIVFSDDVSIYKNISTDLKTNDVKKKYYDQIGDFRKKGIHVSINLVDFNFYKNDQFLSVEELANFMELLVEFMEKHNFDGFEAIWECVPCRSGMLSDVYYYQSTNELMRHLSETFKPRGWLLSAFAVINKTAIEAGFDIQKLSQ